MILWQMKNGVALQWMDKGFGAKMVLTGPKEQSKKKDIYLEGDEEDWRLPFVHIMPKWQAGESGIPHADIRATL